MSENFPSQEKKSASAYKKMSKAALLSLVLLVTGGKVGQAHEQPHQQPQAVKSKTEKTRGFYDNPVIVRNQRFINEQIEELIKSKADLIGNHTFSDSPVRHAAKIWQAESGELEIIYYPADKEDEKFKQIEFITFTTQDNNYVVVCRVDKAGNYLPFRYISVQAENQSPKKNTAIVKPADLPGLNNSFFYRFKSFEEIINETKAETNKSPLVIIEWLDDKNNARFIDCQNSTIGKISRQEIGDQQYDDMFITAQSQLIAVLKELNNIPLTQEY